MWASGKTPGYGSYVRATWATGIAIADGVNTRLKPWSRVYDHLTELVLDSGKGQFEPKHDGFYHITATCGITGLAVAAGEGLRLHITKNGGGIGPGCLGTRDSDAADTTFATVSLSAYLVVGDYIEIWAFQNSGAAKNTAGSYNFITIERFA